MFSRSTIVSTRSRILLKSYVHQINLNTFTTVPCNILKNGTDPEIPKGDERPDWLSLSELKKELLPMSDLEKKFEEDPMGMDFDKEFKRFKKKFNRRILKENAALRANS